MYITPHDEKVFVMDGHVHLWDARMENRRNRFGQTFIDTFYGGHLAMTPPEERWSAEEFSYYGVQRAARDIFETGYCDMALMLPVDLRDFYINGFNTTEQCAQLRDFCPERVILNGRFDPRDGTRGLDQLERDFEQYQFTGAKIYTAEWNGVSRGYSMKDDIVVPYLEKCRALGIRHIHIHKGPTTHPLDYDAFDVRDVDYIATNFPDLNFVVDHCGMPRIDDFCAVAGQEPNVYAGLALVMSYIHARPRYFAHMMSDLLFSLGPDRLLFGSDYAITSPKWIIEKFMAYQFDDETAHEAGTQLTLDVKRKILGLNMAKLYEIDVPQEMQIAQAGS